MSTLTSIQQCTEGTLALTTAIRQKGIKIQIGKEETKVILTDMTINIESSTESTTTTNK